MSNEIQIVKLTHPDLPRGMAIFVLVHPVDNKDHITETIEMRIEYDENGHPVGYELGHQVEELILVGDNMIEYDGLQLYPMTKVPEDAIKESY